MENKVKLCKDCKWYSDSTSRRCKYPHPISVVTGKAVSPHCEISRKSYGACKVQAIYFEEKTTLAVIVKRLYNRIVSYLKRSTITLK